MTITFQSTPAGKLVFGARPPRGTTVRIAPCGADDLGEPRRCLVAPGDFVVVDAKGAVVTARTDRGLRGAAARLGLVIHENFWLP